MSHVDASQLSAYNSLSDKHLAGYFANTKMRGHLRKSGLITRRGQIVTETSYRLNIARKEHKKHVKDLLAQAIVHKTLDLERHRQVAIRQKLEEIAKIELVQRVRGERNCHAVDEALLPLITGSPREKDAPYKRHTRSRSEGKRDRSDSPRSQGHRTPTPRSGGYAENELLIEERVIYVDDDGNTIDMSDCEQPLVRSGRSRTPRSREEIDARHLYSLNPLALRRYATALAKMEQTNTLASPYLIPQIPIPPSSPRTGPARHRSAGNRGRSTSSDKSPKRSPGVDLHRREPAMRHQGDIHSNCEVTMKFHGWALKLARERTDNRHDVSVEQQHCGGNTLTVFKGLIEPGSKFSFTSKRHRGYPFSLTLYVDGRQDARVSTCCEFGHSKKVRLGAKQGHFSFVVIKGMNPCYKCQVQKGMVGGKAPPKKMQQPSSNPGEEVIVVQVSEPSPKETEKAKQSDEEESAHDQILVPVEVDGADARDNNEDAYESDFEDEDDSPSGRSQQPDEVLFHKDWDNKGNKQDVTEEPIAEEPDEDKRQIRGLAADFADDEKEDEKNAFVSAEKSANPDVVGDFEDDTMRKVEGYSSEEEDLDGKKDKTIVVEKKSESGSSSVDSSSDSSNSSGSSSELESESEGELIVQEETPRGSKDPTLQADDTASKEDAAPKTADGATPTVVSTDASVGDEAKPEDSDTNEPQQTKLPAPHATPQPEQTTFPSPPRSPSKSLLDKQTEQVPPPVPTVVVIPTTPDLREAQGSGEWQDRVATPVQGPRQPGGLPAEFEYQPKHSAESDDKTVSGENGQTRPTSESETETENMHGGNDPDRVADDDSAKWQSILEFVQPPPQTMHSGSLTPLLEDQNAIDIHNINLTKPQIVEIMQTIEIKDNLQAVTISNCSLGVDDMNKLLQSLAKSPSNPRILNLNNNILGPRSVVPLVEMLKIKPSIDMLLLQGNPIGNEGLQTLVDGLLDIEFEAQEYKKRESERMGGVPILSIKGRFCQLQELDLSEASITDDGMVDVALLLESNLDLHTLSLSSCPDITKPGWSKLATALAKNKNLKTLTIQNNKVGDEGVQILVEGLKSNTSLSTLEVANAGIGEAGGRALIDLLKRNTTVKYLTLLPGNDIPQKTQDEINRYLALNQSSPSSLH
ncbi:glutamate-rich protein 3-like isoform X8 [Haliotis rufescens]|uniref:glutamate-rich protein 3-like isoform X8 n=1 Tax=Haliotis rufescens TaxID=6454 RepID=UPI00201FA816|nr:glutamate-rich protein 3-like isoform X8 [Haliotis rufescens]